MIGRGLSGKINIKALFIGFEGYLTCCQWQRVDLLELQINFFDGNKRYELVVT